MENVYLNKPEAKAKIARREEIRTDQGKKKHDEPNSMDKCY